METVLFVTHRVKQCGVFEFGKDIFDTISDSKIYQFVKAECESVKDLEEAIAVHSPVIIIYNYHPAVMPWVCSKIFKGIYRNNIVGISILQVAIIHEITQQVADTATSYRNKYLFGSSEQRINSLFDYYIAADPTLLLKNPLVFKTGRLVPFYSDPKPVPAIPTIGSFGFATPNKGFQNVVLTVQKEFDEALIKINMPSADFGDKEGSNAKKIAEECRALINKSGIRLEITHDFFSKRQLLDFLSGNSLNMFLYEDKKGRGISSAIDNALAVKRPIAVSNCPMFRHVLSVKPSACIDDNPLKQILSNGFEGLQKISEDWNAGTMRWEIERIVQHALVSKKQKVKMGIVRTVQSAFRKILSLPDKSFTWLRNTDAVTDDNLSVDSTASYSALSGNLHFNRILNDEARALYQPAVDKLFELVPRTMDKKIARANVQQAFVFDTVCQFIDGRTNPKLLCVGSYEDTASMSLQRLGYEVDEVDPMINYFLQEFYTKPSTIKNSYDIVFSTSVIEHDPDDKSFVECIEGLLKPGGIAVITCDYKDLWKPGDPKPDVDARFYTKYDLEQRLLSYLPSCELVDVPDWEWPNPDFDFLGKYQYSFAAFVFRKKINR